MSGGESFQCLAFIFSQTKNKSVEPPAHGQGHLQDFY